MRNERGVTLASVIVAIIIIIIIASFAIWYSSNTSTEAKLARAYAEVHSVKEAYENAKTLNEINPTTYPISSLFEPVTESWLQSNYARIGLFSPDAGADNLYLITPDNAYKIELEKILGEYVVDMATDKVYLVDGFYRNNENSIVYEFKDIEMLYYNTLK
ncbi:MAG: hypothetical protein IJ217_01095 [Clostridia bacterium]|nr:hypothetical protein [Clostridia bacterium]